MTAHPGGCYVTAKRHPLIPTGPVFEQWERHCHDQGLPFTVNPSVLPPDNSTLFTTSGMQKHKPRFRDPTCTHLTLSDVQRCLRLNDLEEIDDDRHHLVFHMMGLFSFRDWSVPDGLSFWYGFLDRIGVRPTHVTVHPDRWDEGLRWHRPFNVEVRPDPECQWSDGGMGGYCTEFYVGELEIGNVVHPLETCLDVGFGLERLNQVLGHVEHRTGEERLRYTLDVLHQSGVTPGPKGQGYVMRRLLRTLRQRGGSWDHPLFGQEVQRHEKQTRLYHRLLKRHGDKPSSWWWDTHGIDVKDMGPGLP